MLAVFFYYNYTMRRFIYNNIKSIKNQVSFSMPGHKGNTNFDFDFDFDLTETFGTDNLLNPKDTILKSQQEISNLYGVKRSYFIPNGATGAITVILLALTKPKDKILIQRNSHKSVYNSIVLNDLIPEYISGNYDEKENLITGIFIDELEEKLKSNRDIKVVFLTSPNYYGVCLKLKEISEVVKKYGAFLIVDEAHGAHLYFSRFKDLSAINYADAIVHSTHKTLPSLTQSAILHINNNSIDENKILNAMNLCLSTSPSYLLMLSSEFGVNYIHKNQSQLEKIYNEIKKFKKTFDNKNIKFYDYDRNDTTVGGLDSSKLLFSIDGLSGYDIVKKLFFRYNIRLEMGSLNNALALCTISNKVDDFNKLKIALDELLKENNSVQNIGYKINNDIPQMKFTPREAYYMDRENVELCKANFRIAATNISVYPPGVPIVVMGEIITSDIIDSLLNYNSFGAEIVGLKDGKIEVLK